MHLQLFIVLLAVKYAYSGCELDDEFDVNSDNEEIFSQEWLNLMEELDKNTFNTEMKAQCENNSEQSAIITYDSPFIWDLRFEIYNLRQDENDNSTISNCLVNTDCSTEFRDCMKTARTKMLTDIGDIWQNRVNTELVNLANTC